MDAHPHLDTSIGLFLSVQTVKKVNPREIIVEARATLLYKLIFRVKGGIGSVISDSRVKFTPSSELVSVGKIILFWKRQ